MEPGLRDREYLGVLLHHQLMGELQWSPVLETGNTARSRRAGHHAVVLQWSPVLETGNTVPSMASAAGSS